MRAIAAAVGFSETVFVTDGPLTSGRRHYSVRYFAPQAEVPFCGHATVALGTAIGRRLGAGTLHLSSASGDIPIEVVSAADGRWGTTFTSAEPWHESLPDNQLDELLACFGWNRTVMDSSVPPAVADAGARHVIVPVRDRSILSTATYDFHRLRQLSMRHDWVTIYLAGRKAPCCITSALLSLRRRCRRPRHRRRRLRRISKSHRPSHHARHDHESARCRHGLAEHRHRPRRSLRAGTCARRGRCA